MSSHPASPTSSEHIDVLFGRWHHHRDLAARDELIISFLPFAERLAARYRSAREPHDDLVQVARVGLIGAVDRFDPEREKSFSSFAIPTILGELKRHFRDTGWAVHVPRGTQELAYAVEQASRQLAEQTGRAPALLEIARYLQMDIETIIAGLDGTAARYATSLDAPAPNRLPADEAASLGDTIGDEDPRLKLAETRLALSKATEQLTLRERQVLALRVNEQLKQVEIAERLGCSQMQVSRLLHRAVHRLREAGALTS